MLQFKILPDLIDRRSRRPGFSGRASIRLWSAACSTGQEIYSIAIVLKELLGDLSKYSVKLLGTDISDEAIRKASYGVYNRFEIERGMPKDRLMKHFVQQGDSWKIRDEIRGLATFTKINLMNDFTAIGKFDIVFCRNVAIYFAEQDRANLFARIASQLESDGSLIIGSTESLNGICPQLEPKRYLRSVFYQRKNGMS